MKLKENLMTTVYSILVLINQFGGTKMSVKEIMKRLDQITTGDDVNDLVKDLTKNVESDIGDTLFNIIYRNTIEANESEKHWTELALS